MNNLIQNLKKVFIFRLLNEDELSRLADMVKEAAHPKGSVIFSEQDEGDAMFVIKDGLVRISVKREAEDVELTTLMPGDFFGEIALFEKVPRTATAKAVDNTVLYVIHRDDFSGLISNSPYTAIKILFRIIQDMGKRIRISNISNYRRSA